ncbi:MAG: ribonuclease G [Gammaproteobacteria bacterium]|nr:MAG: ribonuclease G [Gammaproteobacteria bacterium]
MGQEILINVTPNETRVAMLENGALQEIFIERSGKRGLVGNIFVGKVSRVLPGMQAAFIDIGLEKAAFLHVSDIVCDRSAEVEGKKLEDMIIPSISALLYEGQKVIVQVIKDPLGTKGARLTTQITIPSRYLVLLPNYENVAVSGRIEDKLERNRLKEIVRKILSESGDHGYIVRTAAESVEEDKLAEDGRFLRKLWKSIHSKQKGTKAPALVHVDLPLALRALRDNSGGEIERIRIDSQDTCKNVLDFCEKFLPEMVSGVEYYSADRPIFDIYGIEDEIQKALERKVILKSGGHMVIDQTEAMTTIDVNTGAYVGSRNLEETIFKTNLEAAQAIARQLRLRNLGGIIIIDFIDMEEQEHREQVLYMLEKSLEQDQAKNSISEVSALGLVQMTRKRTRESLEHILCEICPVCDGRGSIKTAETVCYEIFREITRQSRQFDAKEFLVLASQEVVDLILDEESPNVAELETFIEKPIRFQPEILYTQEQFDVVPV